MRSRLLIAIAALAVMAAAPASAQVSADIHIGPYGNHGGPVYREPVREVIVVPYEVRRHGDYRRYGGDWRPITVYVLGNRYYAQPYRNARPVVVYNYRNNYFLEPRDRGWVEYRSRYQRDRWGDHRRDRDRDWYRGDHDYDDDGWRGDDDRRERDRYDRDRHERERYERDRYERDRHERDRYERYRYDDGRRVTVYQAPAKVKVKPGKGNNGRGKGRGRD